MPLPRADLSGSLVLVVGAEGSGLTRLVRKHCDWLLSIPMYGSVASLNAAVAGLAKDASAKALLVRIDSPGGSVAGGESLHDAIAKVAAKKPVVVVMGGTAASAGYMIAVPAARIWAHEATLTGSIGVLLQAGEVSGLLDRLGITAETIVSGPLKNQPSFTAPISPAGREVLQALVMPPI